MPFLNTLQVKYSFCSLRAAIQIFREAKYFGHGVSSASEANLQYLFLKLNKKQLHTNKNR